MLTPIDIGRMIVERQQGESWGGLSFIEHCTQKWKVFAQKLHCYNYQKLITGHSIRPAAMGSASGVLRK